MINLLIESVTVIYARHKVRLHLIDDISISYFMRPHR